MRIVAIVVAASVIILLFVSGVRITTVEDQREAEATKMELAQSEQDKEELRQKYNELEKLYNEVLVEETDKIPKDDLFSSGLIGVPGQASSDDGETRIIERDRTTTVPDRDDDDDDDNGGNNDSDNPPPSDDDPDIPDVPDIPKPPDLPDLPDLPDVDKTKDGLLKGTPLEDLL